jgi:hypothetical protein
MNLLYRLRNIYSEFKWHFTHWLIIFTGYPEQFPVTKNMSKLGCSLWHKEAFYEYLSWGITKGWEPLLK